MSNENYEYPSTMDPMKIFELKVKVTEILNRLGTRGVL